MSIATDMKVAELAKRVDDLECELALLRSELNKLNAPRDTISLPKQSATRKS